MGRHYAPLLQLAALIGVADAFVASAAPGGALQQLQPTAVAPLGAATSFYPPRRAAAPPRFRAPLALQGTPQDDAQYEEKVEKALKAMVAFSNSYVKNTNTRYCADASIPAVVIKGLAEHKVSLGAPLCPCRHYEDKQAEAKDGYWNCPCVPMRERHECHCMLFLTDDNEFAGDNMQITLEETKGYTDGMSIL